MKKVLFCSLFALLIFFTGCKNSREGTAFRFEQKTISDLQKIPKSESKLSNEELTRVNHTAYELIKNNKQLSQADRLLFDAYLANSQRDFYLLSKQISKASLGTFSPITSGIVQLFYPNADLREFQTNDPYSQAIAAVVLEKAKDRLREERENLKDYQIQKGPEYWSSTKDYYGLKFGSIHPWYLENCAEYRCPKPILTPYFLKDQIRQIKKAMSELNEKKHQAILFWAEEGDWVKIAEDYMRDNQVGLEKRLAVRSVLLSAIIDANGATYDSKYSYWIKRPHMVDPSIHPVIPTPNHPSYPSGHSTIGKTAAVVLSGFFPENKQEWEALAREAGMSRIWAGIHYPMDHEEGVKLGEKVGNEALEDANVLN